MLFENPHHEGAAYFMLDIIRDSVISYNLEPLTINPNYFKGMKSLVAFSNNIVNVRYDVESFSEWDSQDGEGRSSLERWIKTRG